MKDLKLNAAELVEEYFKNLPSDYYTLEEALAAKLGYLEGFTKALSLVEEEIEITKQKNQKEYEWERFNDTSYCFRIY
jgi:hypothetical protein